MFKIIRVQLQYFAKNVYKKLLGTFEFLESKFAVLDSKTAVNVTIKRSNGHGGRVNLTINTLDIDARDGIDYHGGELTIRLSDQVLK